MKPQKCASSVGQMWMLRLDECLRHIFIFNEKISRKFVVVERDALNNAFGRKCRRIKKVTTNHNFMRKCSNIRLMALKAASSCEFAFGVSLFFVGSRELVRDDKTPLTDEVF